MKKKMMWRASNTVEPYFNDVRVPEANILGKPGDSAYYQSGTPHWLAAQKDETTIQAVIYDQTVQP